MTESDGTAKGSRGGNIGVEAEGASTVNCSGTKGCGVKGDGADGVENGGCDSTGSGWATTGSMKDIGGEGEFTGEPMEGGAWCCRSRGTGGDLARAEAGGRRDEAGDTLSGNAGLG